MATLIDTATTTSNPTALYSKFDMEVELHRLEGPAEPSKATIYRVSAGLVELSSSVCLSQNEELEMVCDGRRIESRVAYCRRQKNGSYDVGVRIGPDAYVRSETRMAVDLATRVHVLGSAAPMIAKIVDLSPSGVGMELPMAVPIGARLSVSLGYSTVMGEVRHCAGSGQNYRAGIRIDKLVRCKDANTRIWTDSSGSSEVTAVLAAFEHAVEERQLRSQAILYALAEPLGPTK